MTWTTRQCRFSNALCLNVLRVQVLVGRNPRENDELTRSAADADLWFHARGCPGSHAILRVPASGCASLACCGAPLYGCSELSHGLLALAGSPPRRTSPLLPAWQHTSPRRGTRASPPVIVARAKDVSKPKGAPPGMVKVSRERVVQARPSSVAALAEKAQAA